MLSDRSKQGVRASGWLFPVRQKPSRKENEATAERRRRVVDRENVYMLQTRLRAHMLDRSGTIPSAPARDLAAHLLLYLHDPVRVGALAVQWLQEHLDADRADGSFGSPSDPLWACGQWESDSVRSGIPSTKGTAIVNTDPVMQRIWRLPFPLVVDSIRNKAEISSNLISALHATSTMSKMVAPLTGQDGKPFALIHVDRTSPTKAVWSSRQIHEYRAVLRDVVAPILESARLLAEEDKDETGREFPHQGDLTAAELRVARLAAQGLSYKEVARQLDRSVHTIDHQLRSIRHKLGISSHAKLVEHLSHAWVSQAN